jgi:NCS2 family nucleobase:cation symporter-2/xanthine permease XanP
VAQTLMAVPDPVVGAYIIVLVVYLFMHGLRLGIEDGMTYETIMIVGLSFWLGVGFQEQVLFNELLPRWAQTLLGNGMTAATMIAVILQPCSSCGRSARLDSELAVASVPEVHAFVERAGKRSGWDATAINRLQLAAEEALVIMIERMAASDQRKVRIHAHQDEDRSSSISSWRRATLISRTRCRTRSAATPRPKRRCRSRFWPRSSTIFGISSFTA